jgi:hypothetical protein
MLVVITTARFHRLPPVHPQAKFVRVKWLGTESFVKVALLDGDDGSDLAKRAYEVLEMGKGGVVVGNVVLYKVESSTADEPMAHATTLEAVKAKYTRVGAGPLVGDMHGSWLLATPLFVPGAGESMAAWVDARLSEAACVIHVGC